MLFKQNLLVRLQSKSGSIRNGHMNLSENSQCALWKVLKDSDEVKYKDFMLFIFTVQNFYSEFVPACCLVGICKTRTFREGGELLGLL